MSDKKSKRSLATKQKSQQLQKSQKTHKIQKPLKNNISKERQTRLQILRSLSENTGLSKTQIESLFASLTEMILSHIHKKGSGEFIIPMTGIKVRRVKKKPTKARKMISPLTGQEVVIAGKPARHAVKISALKVLKSALID